MRFAKLDNSIKSSDGVHTLFGAAYVPIGNVKATVQIIHGLCEHLALYDEFMSRLAENGYFCFMHDQLGHGRTAGGLDGLGFFAEENGDRLIVEDAHRFALEFLPDFAGIPHYIFGHSMGSFVARICAVEYPETADGIILAGTSGPQRAAPLSSAVTDVKSRVQGGDHRSQSAQRIFYDTFNRHFRAENRDYSWLSTLPDVIEAHERDELFNFTFSIKAMNDIVKLCMECNTDEWFDSVSPSLRTLIISGENDPLGNFGRGALEVYKRVSEKSGSNASFKLYGGARHELLNEHCKYGVISDILKWLGGG